MQPPIKIGCDSAAEEPIVKVTYGGTDCIACSAAPLMRANVRDPWRRPEVPWRNQFGKHCRTFKATPCSRGGGPSEKKLLHGKFLSFSPSFLPFLLPLRPVPTSTRLAAGNADQRHSRRHVPSQQSSCFLFLARRGRENDDDVSFGRVFGETSLTRAHGDGLRERRAGPAPTVFKAEAGLANVLNEEKLNSTMNIRISCNINSVTENAIDYNLPSIIISRKGDNNSKLHPLILFSFYLCYFINT